MSFLFPLYLLGGLAIGLPILLHLRRRPPKEHMEFSSLMFLEKTPERLTRRTKIERWLLLALRCLALITLALLFGRPYLKSVTLPSEGEGRDRKLILIDRSASMQREDLAEQALAHARKALRDSPSGEELGIAFFDETLEIAGESALWSSTKSDGWIKENYQPGWKATDLGTVLSQAIDLLSDEGENEGKRQIVLISDFQEGASRSSLNQTAWPEEVMLRCLPVQVKEEGNLSLSLAAAAPGTSGNDENAALTRVRISSSTASESESVSLQWEGYPDTKTEVYLAPGTSRVLKAPDRPADAETATLVLQGDTHDFDNRVFVATSQPRPLDIVFLSKSIEPGKAGTALFYLERALNKTVSLEPKVSAKALADFDTPGEDTGAIVLHGDWSREVSGKLREFADKGGLVVALPSAETSPEAFSELFASPDWKLSEAEVEDYAMLADLDFEHPVLVPFARAQMRDFTKVRFWKHRALTIPEASEATSVFARFDSGEPAWLEKRIGEGSVVAFLSGWEPQESQLALSSKFVPILYSILENAGYSARSAPTSYVERTDFRNKEGDQLKTNKPGFYEVTLDENRTSNMAVNLFPTEGSTDPFDPELVFSEFGIPLLSGNDSARTSTEQASEQRLEAEEKEGRQKLWKWLVVAVLIFLVFETWLAGRRQTVTA